MAVILTYQTREGFLFRLDARLKLLMLMSLSIAVFSFTYCEAVICSLGLIYLLLFHGPGKKNGGLLVLSALRFILFLSVIYVLSGISSPEGNSLLQTIQKAGPFLLRLLLLILAGFLFTGTTAIADIRGAAFTFTRRIPFFPASIVSLMFSVTVSTIPLFFTSLRKSREALLCRGPIPWYRPLRRIKALVFPLLTRVIRRSDILTDSLISRGYTTDRSFLLTKLDKRQIAVSSAIVLLLLGRAFSIFPSF